ncbi:hypothetical protein SCHPADRAFT_204864 [Schizopora paradoxa]|uniref:Uncharacterized protein n=1 Tax=Schizopora paradoxa TaxID=27342 RepID=A0A0H2RXS2_9AGAM|nr:hypothetical protein SCHPADRAFT_204864 [Schizopora paradoxa]
MVTEIAHKEPQLPTEILDSVFSFLDVVYEKYGDSTEAIHWKEWVLEAKFPNASAFLPLLLVCKAWHSIAQRWLYRSINIGWGQAMRDNHHLASLVRELHLQTKATSVKAAQEEFSDYLQLLRLCKRAESITIEVYQYSMVPELLKASKDLDMVELYISFELEEGENDLESFDIAGHLQLWPRLQHFCIFDTCDCLQIAEMDRSSILRGLCPALQDVDLSSISLTANQALSLSKVAPNVRRFTTYCKDDALEALSTCLRTWSSNLTYLSFGVYGTRVRTPSLIAALSGLHALRYLTGHSTHIPPNILTNFEKLKCLTYLCTAEDLHELALMFLQGTSTLPSLYHLELVGASDDSNVEFDEEASSEEDRVTIGIACRVRNINLQEYFPSDEYSD